VAHELGRPQLLLVVEHSVVHRPKSPLGGRRLRRFGRLLSVGVDVVEGQVPPDGTTR
jgi:hypothetical protein